MLTTLSKPVLSAEFLSISVDNNPRRCQNLTSNKIARIQESFGGWQQSLMVVNHCQRWMGNSEGFSVKYLPCSPPYGVDNWLGIDNTFVNECKRPEWTLLIILNVVKVVNAEIKRDTQCVVHNWFEMNYWSLLENSKTIFLSYERPISPHFREFSEFETDEINNRQYWVKSFKYIPMSPEKSQLCWFY